MVGRDAAPDKSANYRWIMAIWRGALAALALIVLGACSDNRPPGTSSEVPLGPLLSLEEEIEFDYTTGWDEYFAVMGDPSVGADGLVAAYTGSALDTMQRVHGQHVGEGTSIQFPADPLRVHRIELTMVDEVESVATLVDCFTENSFRDGPDGLRRNEGSSTGLWTATLVLEVGRWKIADIDRTAYWEGDQDSCE